MHLTRFFTYRFLIFICFFCDISYSQFRKKHFNTLSLYSIKNFPLDIKGSGRGTIPSNFPLQAYLFTDIFISGLNIYFISICYPDMFIDYYGIKFRVVEHKKTSEHIKKIGKTLRLADLTVNQKEDEQVVIGTVSSPKLRQYLGLTNSLVLEVTYGKLNQTYHLYREVLHTEGTMPKVSLSVFALFRHEHESQIFTWMDYYAGIVGVEHFVLYYNGKFSDGKIANIMEKISREGRSVTIAEWYQVKFNETFVFLELLLTC